MRLAAKYRALVMIESSNDRRRNEFLKDAFGVESLEGIIVGEIMKHPLKKGLFAVPVRHGNKDYLLELDYERIFYTRVFKRARRYIPISLDINHYDS